MKDYKMIAKQSRLKCLELVHKAGTSHIGSLFSCADIMAVLFEKINLDKDLFVLSAGWKACMLYFHLWKKGRITEEELNSFCQPGSKWIGLAEPVCEDIKIAGGSMGLSFPGAVGLALAQKLKGEKGKVYCLMSDGEMQIGTTWESALIAAHHELDNLVVIVDYNKFQAMGKTNEILKIEPLIKKWIAFGWCWQNIDGHNLKLPDKSKKQTIEEALTTPNIEGKPQVIIAHTIKGKGVSFIENNNLWHYSHVSKETLDKALKELNIGV